MSGKHFLILKKYTLYSGSPTHTREVLLHLFLLCCSFRITHAYAGSTKPIHRLVRRAKDHPRMRGKHVSGVIYSPLL